MFAPNILNMQLVSSIDELSQTFIINLYDVNTFKPNGISHYYLLDQSIFVFRVIFFIFIKI